MYIERKHKTRYNNKSYRATVNFTHNIRNTTRVPLSHLPVFSKGTYIHIFICHAGILKVHLY